MKGASLIFHLRIRRGLTLKLFCPIRRENTNKLVFAHININSFESLFDQVKGNIDVLMISETNIDDSFPLGNFLIGGFCKP